MNDGLADEESDAEAAEKVCDGLEIMAAYCAIESAELRRAVKRIVMVLSGQAGDRPDLSCLRACADPRSDSATARAGEHDDE